MVCNKKILHYFQTGRQKYCMKAVIWWFADTAFSQIFLHIMQTFSGKRKKKKKRLISFLIPLLFIEFYMATELPYNE